MIKNIILCLKYPKNSNIEWTLLYFQSYTKPKSQTRYWLFSTLILQTVICSIVLLMWGIRLFKKGKCLVKNDQRKGSKEDQLKHNPGSNKEDQQIDNELFKLAKNHHMAKLDYDLDRINQSRKDLVVYLKSEHAKMNLNFAKRIMIKKIRISLVKNPYDQVGRQMASDTKDIFKENVLKEFPPCFQLLKCKRIPDLFLKQEWIKKTLLYSPVIFAIGGLVLRMGIYTNDMSSDIKVIQELAEFEKNFHTPTFSQFFNNRSESINTLETFFLENFTNYGLPVITEPCELLDLVDQIPRDIIPLYKYLVIDIAKIHWNPNRNVRVKDKRTNATFQLYDLFEVTSNIIDIYENHIKKAFYRIKKANRPTKPSEAPKIIKDIITKLKKGQTGLNSASSGFLGIGVKLVSLFTQEDWGIAEIKPLVESGIKILEEWDSKVLNTKFIKTIFVGLDKVYARLSKATIEAEDSGLLDSLKELNEAIQIDTFTHDTPYTPKFDPLYNTFSKDQLECRKFGKKITNLMNIPSLKETAIKFYTEGNTSSMIDSVSRTVSKKLDFMIMGIMRSAKIFLIITFVWTILYGLRNVLIDMILSRHWPLFTNFEREYLENFSNSSFFKGEGSMSNDYVVKTAQRYDFNIHEAIKETLATLNVQVAVWIALATFINKFRDYIEDTFAVHLDNKLFNLEADDFAAFRKSAVFVSLMAGIVSLTFAQWKQYMIRHQNDSSLIGKLVYFLACFFNSIAIIVSQSTFYIIGFPYLTCVLLVIMRYISNFDEYSALVEPTDTMIVILYFVVVLVPLKFVPEMFDAMVKICTDRLFFHKTHHMNNHNRSGYDISG